MSHIVFLIISPDGPKAEKVRDLLRTEFPKDNIFYAPDGASGLSKAENVPPTAIFSDWDLAKISGSSLAQQVMTNKALAKSALVFLEEDQDSQLFSDEILNGRIQVLPSNFDAPTFKSALGKCISWSASQGGKEFLHRNIAKGQVLIHEGDKAQCVFVLKAGKLLAYHEVNGTKTILGEIQPGEFVGEMAFLNGGVRSASVEATMDSELVEIPFRTFGSMLKQSPKWGKSLMADTLARRLKPGQILKKFVGPPKP